MTPTFFARWRARQHFKTIGRKRYRKLLASPDPLTTEALIDGLRLTTKARAAARLNLPAAESSTPAPSETNIRDIITLRALHRRSAIARDCLDLKRQAEALPRSLDHPFAKLIPILRAEAYRLLTTSGDELTTADSDVKLWRGAIERLRQACGIARPAILPASRFLAIMLLLALVVFETSFNAASFALKSPNGFLGGAQIAFLLASTNIMAGFTLGLAALRPLINPPAPWHYVWTLPTTLALTGTIGLLSFLTAHARELMAAGETASANALAARIGANSFGFDVQSVVLLIVSVIFAGYSAFKGFKFDDPAFGYGPLTRQHKAAQLRFSQSRDQCLADLAQFRHAIDGQIEDSIDDARTASAALATNIHHLQAQAAGNLLIDASEAECHDSAVAHYRATNLASRSDGQLPAGFANRYDIRAGWASYAFLDAFVVDLKSRRKNLHASITALEDLQLQFNGALSEALIQAQSLILDGELTPEPVHHPIAMLATIGSPAPPEPASEPTPARPSRRKTNSAKKPNGSTRPVN